ncbi:MAG: hypothetical protein HYR91_09095 [Flavobacteriia bacterium]|nr:hypothetical protein [Flavobacteriia bacterium]
MKPQLTFQGRSLFFNSLFIFVNLVGLIFVVLGFHKNFESYKILFTLLGFGLMLLTILGIIIFKGKLMFSSVSRVIVGSICIVSGLVKANDPIGFSYKLKEYFEDGALAYRLKELFSSPTFSLEFLMDYALPLSIFICILEIVLGVLLLIGGQIKIIVYLTLLMMLFFTFLTSHTASCDAKNNFLDRDVYATSSQLGQLKLQESKTNKLIKIHSKTATHITVDELKQPQCVSDCGCFGDALKGSLGRSLTPIESWWKDLILVYLIVWIFISQRKIKANTWRNNLWFLIFSFAIILFFAWVFGWAFPILFGFIVLFGSMWIRQVYRNRFGELVGGTLFTSFVCSLFIFYVIRYEPMKDFRAYAVGSNLLSKMYNGVDGKYDNILIYKNKKTGKLKELSSNSTEYTHSKIWENKNWKFIKMNQKIIVEPVLPSITEQFNPFISVRDISSAELKIPFIKLQLENQKNETDEISLRKYIVREKRIFILSTNDLVNADWTELNRIKNIRNQCLKLKIPFVLITNASRNSINHFRKYNHFNVPTFANDETELKAISRSNPSLMIIKKAIVIGKYPHRSIPTFEWIHKNLLQK